MFINPKRATQTILVCSAITIAALLFSLTQWHTLSAIAAAPALNTLTVNSASATSPFRAGVGLGTSMALSWSPTGNLATARYLHTATLLPNGKVLVAGGQGNGGSYPVNSELYDPATEIWNITGNLTTGRYFHTATLLPNGKVLVVGGYNPDSLASAEIYDPALGTWSPTGSLATARNRHTATLLPNGKVLVTGGYSTNDILASAELYDPALGTWTATGSFVTARTQHTATLLPNGKVLVAGGRGNSGFPNSAEIYDPATGMWTATGNLATARVSHTMTLLQNGKVLVAGGHDGGLNMSSAELYDPATGTWNSTGSLNTACYLHTATLLPNGKVLVVGGTSSNNGNLADSEPYDPATEMWGTYSNLNTARYWHTATLLPNGRVLIAGGIANSGYLSSAEITEAVTQAPTITGATLSRQAGTTASPSQIATVGDAEDAEDTLNVTATPLSGSGITLSGISIDSDGNVTAYVGADCNATTSIFTLRVTDSGGLFAEATLTVNVVDTIAPTITLLGANPMTVQCPTGFTDPGATAQDNCAGARPVTASGGVNISTPGSYTITYTANDGNGNTATTTRTVNVTANTPPMLIYSNQAVSPGGSLNVSPMTATDNGAITGYSIVSIVPPLNVAPTVNSSGVVMISNANPSGNHVITVQATDNCNATTNAMFTLTVNTPPSMPTITVLAPALIANGGNVTVSSVLTSGANTPLSNRTVTLSIGSGAATQSCTATTSSTGLASCTITNVNQPLGPGLLVRANFAGDGSYLSSSASTSSLVFAYAVGNGGGFVIGNQNAAVGTAITFWGAQWAKENSLSGGVAPSAFKGFANRSNSNPVTCGNTWFTDPGNSSDPPTSVPSYMAVIVASTVTKSGSTISGNASQVVVVRTNAGYAANPGHAGTGTVVGILCP